MFRLLCLSLAFGVVGLAVPVANAAMISRIGDHEVCVLMATMGRDAAVMRQSGVGQQTAANRMSRSISGALANGSGSTASRQRLADLVGAEATSILRLVYSVPVGRTEPERTSWVIAAGKYIYGYCMGMEG